MDTSPQTDIGWMDGWMDDRQMREIDERERKRERGL